MKKVAIKIVLLSEDIITTSIGGDSSNCDANYCECFGWGHCGRQRDGSLVS